MRISSRQNPIVNRFKAVARGEAEGMLLLDGVHLLQDALAAGIEIVNVAIDAGAVERRDISRLAEVLRGKGLDPIVATAPVMGALSPVRSPTGIVAIARRPERDVAEFYKGPAPLVLIATDIQDPGNLGAIVRVAEAGGATSVLAAGASADPFGWKALRGSMGSALRLPVDRVDAADTAIAEARRRRCRIVATVPRDGRSLYDVDLAGATAVLIGGEGPGLPESLIESADERLTIPMERGVESLNAAATAALIVYEARRQRHVSVS
ncbi:MAG TPA: RNA methyltransferase [Vicinamibacterales bacterium]|nr:RNA methyltransferase [Vicinamibacterales bacterium]